MSIQDTKIIPLKVSSVCNNNEDLARELEYLANLLRKEEYDNVRMFCCVLDSDTGVYRYTAGPPGVNTLETVGLLTWASTLAVK